MSAARWHRTLVKAVLKSLRRDFWGGSQHRLCSHYGAQTHLASSLSASPGTSGSISNWTSQTRSRPRGKISGTTIGWSRYRPLYGGSTRGIGGGRRRDIDRAQLQAPMVKKLYAIHVAPGVDRDRIRRTKPRGGMYAVAGGVRDFLSEHRKRVLLFSSRPVPVSGAVKRGFDRCFSSAQRQTGNFKWSLPGPRPKFPR